LGILRDCPVRPIVMLGVFIPGMWVGGLGMVGRQHGARVSRPGHKPSWRHSGHCFILRVEAPPLLVAGERLSTGSGVRRWNTSFAGANCWISERPIRSSSGGPHRQFRHARGCGSAPSVVTSSTPILTGIPRRLSSAPTGWIASVHDPNSTVRPSSCVSPARLALRTRSSSGWSRNVSVGSGCSWAARYHLMSRRRRSSLSGFRCLWIWRPA
jgi:hypothetical protein